VRQIARFSAAAIALLMTSFSLPNLLAYGDPQSVECAAR
jgi:hypothetical protein